MTLTTGSGQTEYACDYCGIVTALDDACTIVRTPESIENGLKWPADIPKAALFCEKCADEIITVYPELDARDPLTTPAAAVPTVDDFMAAANSI